MSKPERKSLSLCFYITLLYTEKIIWNFFFFPVLKKDLHFYRTVLLNNEFVQICLYTPASKSLFS